MGTRGSQNPPGGGVRRTGTLLLLTCMALPALAASERRGIGYYDAQDYPRAISELQPFAEAGRPASQYYLAMSQRAQQRRDLGLISLVPVPQDPRQQQSHEWFGKAAAQGHVDAMVEYAVDFNEGYGVEVEYTQALGWMNKARAAGSGRAMSYLQDWYRTGHIVKPDEARADALLAETEARRPRSARSTAREREIEANIQRTAREALAAIPTQPDIDAAAAGDAEAALRLAELATDSVLEKPDCGAADRWYRRAAELGLGDAYYELGLLFYDGTCGQDIAQARDLFEAAARVGNTRAPHRLAAIYRFGHLGAPDYTRAYTYERLAWSLDGADAPPGPLAFDRRHMSAEQVAAAEAEVARLLPVALAHKERRDRRTTVRQVALREPPAGARWSYSLTLTDTSGTCARNFLQRCDYVPFHGNFAVTNLSESTLACSLKLVARPLSTGGAYTLERRVVVLPDARRALGLGRIVGEVDARDSSLDCEVVTQPSMETNTCAMQLPQGAAPTYPPAALRRGEEGVVQLQVIVPGTRARPSQASVARSSGFASLDEAALRFITDIEVHTNCPGVPATVPLDFRLQD